MVIVLRRLLHRVLFANTRTFLIREENKEHARTANEDDTDNTTTYCSPIRNTVALYNSCEVNSSLSPHWTDNCKVLSDRNSEAPK